jgi:hypothetical protein
LEFLRESTRLLSKLNHSKKPFSVYKKYLLALRERFSEKQRKELLRNIALREGIEISRERINFFNENELIEFILKKKKEQKKAKNAWATEVPKLPRAKARGFSKHDKLCFLVNGR